jgi:hypothetical protein
MRRGCFWGRGFRCGRTAGRWPRSKLESRRAKLNNPPPGVSCLFKIAYFRALNSFGSTVEREARLPAFPCASEIARRKEDVRCQLWTHLGNPEDYAF